MKLKIMSDIHASHHMDCGKTFFRSVPTNNADVLVLAGDIECLSITLPIACKRFDHVIFVLGNHEFYHKTRRETLHEISILQEHHDNLHWLEKSTIKIDEQRFVGTTLWFPFSAQNPLYEHLVNDFHLIEGFRRWNYEQNKLAQEFLRNAINENDVVVTHHLPSYACIDKKHALSNLNRFFACQLDDLIWKKNPKMWIMGHTHASVDQIVGETRMICNPFGYLRREENDNFDERLTLEI